MRGKIHTKLLIVLAILLFQVSLLSQTTGKIAGLVSDKETGEPLMGVNIWLEGTDFGASTGLDGDFFIINIPPGEYLVKIQMIGYQETTVEDVRISVNRTFSLDVELSSETITTETVIVQAERVAIKKDQTGTVANVSAAQIEILPVENVDQVIDMQAGVVQGSFRGGRSNEVSFLVEGVQVDNNFDQDGGRAVEIENEAISDLEVVQGTFNAEYGRAMSGIVNAVIKDGGKNFEASASAAFSNYFTNNTDVFIGLEPSELTRNQDYKLFLSGPTGLNDLTFVVNARYQDQKDYLNGIRRYTVTDYNDYLGTVEGYPAIISTTGDDEYVPMAGRINFSLLGKLSYKVSQMIRTSFLFTYNDDQWNWYDHAWKYNPDGRPSSFRESYFYKLEFNHMLNNSMFYDLKFSLLDNYNGTYLYEDPFDPAYVHGGYNRNDTPGPGFVTGGQDHGHTRRNILTLNGKFDYSWQINRHHYAKAGILATQHQLDQRYVSIQNFYRYSDELRDARYIDPLTGRVLFAFYKPDIEYNSIYSDFYKVYPYEVSAYFQDKMEFEEMVFNIGLRYDYFNPNAIYPADWRNPKNEILNAPKTEHIQANAKTQVSPRLGLSYLLSDRAVLHFSYGHFFQMPPMYALYQNRDWYINSSNYQTTLGNPDLNAQKTVQYEVGLWQELNDMMSLEVTLYYRDIYELLSTRVITTYNETRYGLFTNLDYGNSRGLALKYDVKYENLIVWMNYTLQYTRANAASPAQNFDRQGSESDPITELIPMDWDQRHTFNVTAGYNNPVWGITASAYYNSGTPYSWEPLETSRVYFVYLLPNNSFKPAGFTADLNAYYRYKFSEHINLRLNLNVYNLFDALNENWVYARTGRAYTDVILESERANHVSDFNTIYDRIEDPSAYAAPREIKLGIGVEF